MKPLISSAFEDLSHSFRILLEQSHFYFPKLLETDKAEAIGNLEASLTGNLNAFHSIYDAMNKEISKSIKWYHTPELCLILILRNARHHNFANKIRSIYTFHNQKYVSQTVDYLFVNFDKKEDKNAFYFNVPISWQDIDDIFELPFEQTRVPVKSKNLVREYLKADLFESLASENNIPKELIFINYPPLIKAAAIKLYPYIKGKIALNSTEVEAFSSMFDGDPEPIIKNHEYVSISMKL